MTRKQFHDLGSYWISPELTSINRLPMLSIPHLHSLSLNGRWRFQLLDHPRATPSRKWSEMEVPGLWTMQQSEDGSFRFGDKPIYTNVQMPFDHLPPLVPDKNPTGVFERDFDYSTIWRGKRVVLTIGGFESVATLYINGSFVGLAKDSRLHASFDITDYLTTGKNTVRIVVVKWSDATFIEDQDQWWHGGITRSVTIHATEKVFIERLHTQAGLLKDGTTGTLRVRAYINSIQNTSIEGWTLRARVAGVKKELRFEAEVTRAERPNWTEMTPAQRRASSEFFRGTYWDGNLPKEAREALIEIEPPGPGIIEFTGRIPGITAWSAEIPKLYEVEFELLDPEGKPVEISTQRIGFRSIEVKGKEFLVNGKPVILYGVNRHDFNKETGRVLTRELFRQDLLELKRWNFNAVRTSHYPNDPIFLDLCDELGFYVIDEANIESHAFQDSICNDQKYLNAFVDRIARLAQRDIHHPSVIAWSLGNESGSGLNHDAAAAYLRSFDESRPLHYEGAIRGNWTIGQNQTDIVCPMYPEIAAIVAYAKSKKADRPLIMCEYSHAMGNSNGTLKEYWDAIHSTPGLQGGFIWEFWDHGIDQYLQTPTVTGVKKRSAYGGDFGEERHDGNFVCDGLFFPDRSAKPALHEFKYLAAPVSFTSSAPGKVTIFNKNFFASLDGYSLHFEVTVDGESVDSGTIPLKRVAPRSRASLQVKSNKLNDKSIPGERFLTLSLRLRETTAWGQVGHEVAWAQFPLSSRSLSRPSVKKTEHLPSDFVTEDGELKLPWMVKAPTVTLWRAPTDNDLIGHIATKWNEWGLRELQLVDCTIRDGAKATTITSNLVTGSGIKVSHLRRIETIDGGVRITESVKLPKVLDDVARVGVRFGLDKELSEVTWFGAGRHESAPDRKIGRIHRWRASVSELHTDYIKPQESSARADVRWVTLKEVQGRGPLIRLDKPRFVTISPFESTMLADTSHNVDLVRSDWVNVTIDAIQRGVGTASCGPDTLSKYIIKPGTYTWSWDYYF
ncbi:MAG: glycoside hydrolase family 2 TIM barrel-domain containing protein [Candidatus Nanopelagicaceae bacterium]